MGMTPHADQELDDMLREIRAHRFWSPKQVADFLGRSEQFVRSEIDSGALRARRLGRRVVILRATLQAYITDLPMR